jgi:hypothetical protein
MAHITKNFHIIHMTDDIVELDAWYDDVFSVVRYMDQQYSDILQRHGSLVLVGDLCIEPMQPAFEAEGWDQYPVGRFWNRFGKRWHSIAWYVEGQEDFNDLYRSFVANDVRVLSGRGDASDDEPPPGAIFTHPRDTYTQLEFIKEPPPNGGDPGRRVFNPLFHGSFDPGWWTTNHPLQVCKSSSTTLTVGDVEKARDLYVDVIGGTLLHEAEMPLTMTRSAFVATGDDLVVELAEPLDPDSPLAKDMELNGEGLYSVGMKVADLGDAERYLRSKGIDFAHADGTTLYTDPATTHGVVFSFTTWEIPNDPRPHWR